LSAHSGRSPKNPKTGSDSSDTLEQGSRASGFVTTTNDRADFKVEFDLLCDLLNLVSRLSAPLCTREDLIIATNIPHPIHEW
jgi:hypothetical protein